MRARVSYLRGLVEGLNVSDNSKEGQVIKEIVNVLEDFAQGFEELDIDLGDLEQHVDAMDLDLEALETDYYDEEYLIEEEQGRYHETICPTCNEAVVLGDNLFNQEGSTELYCPTCNDVLYVTEETSPELEYEFEHPSSFVESEYV
ncbi:CD1247 N-terminal domain-containing protein [Natranaerobius trueperi]|uniref:AraC family transcriptional regulator n=1 Tax=Natranaerobius trueperi TaxID=759412 RepID=A0A226BZ25_9FIRM|nr:CD1247 N-terminal domain-containing protein [Natranaerobius trueperi]OWZ84032.1 hypothetical protein CDO51_05595 [Natranaerobius trueperi]